MPYFHRVSFTETTKIISLELGGRKGGGGRGGRATLKGFIEHGVFKKVHRQRGNSNPTKSRKYSQFLNRKASNAKTRSVEWVCPNSQKSINLSQLGKKSSLELPHFLSTAAFYRDGKGSINIPTAIWAVRHSGCFYERDRLCLKGLQNLTPSSRASAVAHSPLEATKLYETALLGRTCIDDRARSQKTHQPVTLLSRPKLSPCPFIPTATL